MYGTKVSLSRYLLSIARSNTEDLSLIKSALKRQSLTLLAEVFGESSRNRILPILLVIFVNTIALRLALAWDFTCTRRQNCVGLMLNGAKMLVLGNWLVSDFVSLRVK